MDNPQFEDMFPSPDGEGTNVPDLSLDDLAMSANLAHRRVELACDQTRLQSPELQSLSDDQLLEAAVRAYFPPEIAEKILSDEEGFDD
jgi:hypothetical protein